MYAVCTVAYLGFYFGGGGGGSKYFCKSGGYLQRVRSHVFARGVWGHAPPKYFLKIVQFGAFWGIFCKSFVKKKLSKYPFFI